MTYLVDIRLEDGKRRTYRIDAKDETEAKERLPLRLPPSQRETFTIDSIKIDPASLGTSDPFGTFLLDND